MAHIHINCPDKYKEELQARAAKKGMTLTKYLLAGAELVELVETSYTLKTK
jgi:hypothetical protein